MPPLEVRRFTLAKALTEAAIPQQSNVTPVIFVKVRGYQNTFVWPLIPENYPDLNPRKRPAPA